ncbi:MAG: hypothetical protein ACYC1Y_03645 [Minisyncoccota bacterium]
MLLLILVVGVIGVVSIFYIKATLSTQTNTTSTSPTPVAELLAANILPDTSYVNLTSYEKTLVDRFVNKYPSIYSNLLAAYNNDEMQSKSQIKLKYYDNETIALVVPNGKAGGNLSIYAAKDLQELNKKQAVLFGNYTESNSHIIVASDAGFIFYKKGATDFQIVPNSSLNPKNETYMKEGGFGGVYDFTFNEPTKTLTASTFKPVFNGGAVNPKIRTVKFVLP